MTDSKALAIDGGPQAKTSPYGKAARFQGNELKYLEEALNQNTLFYGHGRMVKQACEAMAAYTGMPHIVPCSSGSASIHLGLIAAGIGPGDEVITTPNTDSGTILGVIEEGAVPVFCDCEWTLQPSARTVAARITERTRAVVVVHLAGYPAPVEEIVALCAPRGIAVIEDAAQSWGTRRAGRRAGTSSVAGCFSTNDYKHISTGDGGFVALRDEALYRRVHNYSDKHYDRLFGRGLFQAHHGMNYRMSELQGAVACAQLEQVDAITARQHEVGDRLCELLRDLPGTRLMERLERAYCTYWWTALFLEPDAFSRSRDGLVEAMRAEGVAVSSYGRYDLIGSPLFQERIARPWLDEDRRRYPFEQPDGRSYTYSFDDTPIHKQALETGVMISISSGYTDTDVEETAAGIRKVVEALRR